MRSWLIGLLAGCLAAQDPPRKPVAPATQVEITAPDGEWFDGKRLTDLVGAARPMAEKYSGLKFVRDPMVLAADEASWDRLIAAERPDARDHDLAVAITLALYLPARDEVVLGPLLAHELLRRDTKDGPSRLPFLVHELVHVLQEQHFQLGSRLKAASVADEKLVLRAMNEGFATWVEEQVAVVEFALADYSEKNTRKHRRNARMEYIRGRDFFARLRERGGEKAMHDAMRGPPLKLFDFVRIATARPAEAKPDDDKAGDGKRERDGK